MNLFARLALGGIQASWRGGSTEEVPQRRGKGLVWQVWYN